jgi:hypothetical protein
LAPFTLPDDSVGAFEPIESAPKGPPLKHQHLVDILSRAAGSPKGIKIEYPSKTAATAARFKFYRARDAFRKRVQSSSLDRIFITIQPEPDGIRHSLFLVNDDIPIVQEL